jgi:hypothetical protein
MAVTTTLPHRVLVHYLSPFDQPRWLSPRQAQGSLERDERRWSCLEELEMVSDAQFADGPPHIETPIEAR